MICQECGQELQSPIEKHTFEDCQFYKEKCKSPNLERRIAKLERLGYHKED